MVTCKLRGGLGNQMFQIAATIGLAKKHGVEFRIPLTLEHGDKRGVYGKFSHFPQLTDEDKISLIYNEPSFSYSEIPYQDGICLNGYFQSAHYFSHCFPEIKKAFKIDYSNRFPYCSIHVRRGDYIENPNIHTNLDMDYYNEAIEYIEGNTRSTCREKFVVFSDDIAWCRKNFIGDKFIFSTEKSDIKDMALMSQCRSHIIANSSFSWWGAHLSIPTLTNNTPPVIVAPKNWFGKDSGIKDWESIYTAQCVDI